MILSAIFISIFKITQERNFDSKVDITKDVPGDFESVSFYIQSCLKTVSNDAIFLLGQKGGIIYSFENQQNVYSTQTQDIANLNRFDYFNSPFMETQLLRYMEENFNRCVNYTSFEDKGYVFKKKPLNFIIDINALDVSVRLNYPIEVSFDKSKHIFDYFYYKSNVRLGQIISDISEFNLTNDKYLDPNKLFSKNYDFVITPLDRYTILIILKDSNSEIFNKPFGFNFVVQYINNKRPFLMPTSDFFIERGTNFEYQFEAYDSDLDELKFYSSNPEITINSMTGLLNKTFYVDGYFTTVISVEDGFGNVDNMTVNFQVG